MQRTQSQSQILPNDQVNSSYASFQFSTHVLLLTKRLPVLRIIHGHVAIRTRGRTWPTLRSLKTEISSMQDPWRIATPHVSDGKQKRRRHFRNVLVWVTIYQLVVLPSESQLDFREWGDEVCGGVDAMASRRHQSIACPVFWDRGSVDISGFILFGLYWPHLSSTFILLKAYIKSSSRLNLTHFWIIRKKSTTVFHHGLRVG